MKFPERFVTRLPVWRVRQEKAHTRNSILRLLGSSAVAAGLLGRALLRKELVLSRFGPRIKGRSAIYGALSLVVPLCSYLFYLISKRATRLAKLTRYEKSISDPRD
jgi:hypothetical protein